MIDLKTISKTDPVRRNVEKGLEQVEHTPMEPPAAYPKDSSITSFENFRKPLQILMEEHKKAIPKIEKFEQALIQFKTNGYKLDPTINNGLKEFFSFLDNELFPHNNREEKILFPVLHRKLIENGEHGIGINPKTAIDVMEDDHVKFIQLGALTFNLLGLATRLKDTTSQIFVLDTAYENGRELIELLKLHIYREDYTLFPLAQQLVGNSEFDVIEKEMLKHR